MNIWYKDYAEFLSEIFPGTKVQKISVNAGFTCPNRDGKLGTGGCIYCNNIGFSPDYCHTNLSVTEQIKAGREFFRRKYPRMKYIAYFQNFTSTYGEIGCLLELYTEALACDDVVGLIIGTRPDCMNEKILAALAEINGSHPVIIEYGAETSHNRTLSLINRGHTWEQTRESVLRTKDKGLRCGLHLIMGLPGETTEDMIETVDRVIKMPVDSIKFHHLQILRDTPLHRMYLNGEIECNPFMVEDYMDLCIKIIDRVPHNIAIERFLSSSPPELVVAPKWGLKNHEFTDKLFLRLKERGHYNNSTN